MNKREQFKLKLKILGGLPPTSPTDQEVRLIIAAAQRLAATRRLTEGDWRQIIAQVVPDSGRYRYAAEDMSDLNELLEAILREGQGR